MQREALEHPLLQDATRFRAWFWLVANAAWKETKFNIRGATVPIARGQLCVSIRQLADAWGMSKSAADRFLTRLETETMVEREAGHGRLILTICNYAKYQSCRDAERDTDGTEGGTPAGHHRDTKEQGNKVIPNGITITSREPFPKPDWCEDDQVWRDFKANRRRKRLPNTESAYKGFLDDIRRIADDEWPPPRLLAHAATKGWGGIYDPRTSHMPGNDNRPQRGSSIASLLDDVRQVHGL